MSTATQSRPGLQIETRLFIGGEFVDAAQGGRSRLPTPTTTACSREFSEATAPDVDRAVDGRPQGFPRVEEALASDRGRLLLKLADAIEADAEYLAQLEAMDTGHPIRDVRNLDIPRTAAAFRYFGGIADKVEGTHHAGRAGSSTT